MQQKDARCSSLRAALTSQVTVPPCEPVSRRVEAPIESSEKIRQDLLVKAAALQPEVGLRAVHTCSASARLDPVESHFAQASAPIAMPIARFVRPEGRRCAGAFRVVSECRADVCAGVRRPSAAVYRRRRWTGRALDEASCKPARGVQGRPTSVEQTAGSSKAESSHTRPGRSRTRTHFAVCARCTALHMSC